MTVHVFTDTTDTNVITAHARTTQHTSSSPAVLSKTV
jgi:hypothetical protein